MKKSELKSIIQEVVREAIGLGVAESDMNDPEEKREVEIANEILKNCKRADQRFTGMTRSEIDKISSLAKELIEMHNRHKKIGPKKPMGVSSSYDPYGMNDYVKETKK